MKKNRKLWIVSAALVAVVLVAALCLLLPRLQVEPGVPKSGAIVRQEAAEDGRQLFVLERETEHISLQEIMDESDLVVMGFLLEQSPGFQVKSTDGEDVYKRQCEGAADTSPSPPPAGALSPAGSVKR